MPNIKKEIEKCKHPNSRKTLALTKQIKKLETRKKQKTGQFVKQNLIAEKILWFKDNLQPNINVCSPEHCEELIQKYLSRFDDELEQIEIKHSIGNRKNRQHASREDIIKMTKKREQEEFNTCGIEMPDLFNEKNLQVLLKWNGELRFLQNMKLRRVSKKFLQQQINKITNKKQEAEAEPSEDTSKINKDIGICMETE